MSSHDNEYHGHVLHPREQNDDLGVHARDERHETQREDSQLVEEEGTTRLTTDQASDQFPEHVAPAQEQSEQQEEAPRADEENSRQVTGEEQGSNDRPDRSETVEQAHEGATEPGMASARTLGSPDRSSFDFEQEHPKPETTNSALSVDFKDFDKLTVPQVLKQAKILSKDQLSRLIKHEQTHRKRKTLITKLQNLANNGKSKE